jgi:hypothetical protein
VTVLARFRDISIATMSMMNRMVTAAPRIDRRLRRTIRRLEVRYRCIADINRAVGSYSSRLGLARPSYEQVRQYVHRARSKRRRLANSLSVVADVHFRRRPVEDLLSLLEGYSRAESLSLPLRR